MSEAKSLAPEGLLVNGPEAGVLEIRLNRPEARNALSTPLLRGIVGLLEQAESDDAVRCVVLTGGDSVFAAGADLAEMAAKDMQAVLLEERPRLFAAIGRFPKPVVGAVCGYALGGGCELVMHADLIVAGESAQFGQPEINLGIIPGYAGTQRLSRLIGRGRALELLLTGDQISAAEALRLGLVNRVVPAAELMSEARKLAHGLATKAPIAARYIIDAVNRGLQMPFPDAQVFEATLFGLVSTTDDMREGTAAFLEKRTAEFKGK